MEQRRQWRKVHLAIDADTFEIRAVEVTDNSIGDAPILPQLLSQILEDEPIDSVTGDRAYDQQRVSSRHRTAKGYPSSTPKALSN